MQNDMVQLLDVASILPDRLEGFYSCGRTPLNYVDCTSTASGSPRVPTLCHNVGERKSVASRIDCDSSATSTTTAVVALHAAAPGGIATICLNQPTPVQNVHVQVNATAARTTSKPSRLAVG